MDGVSLCKIAHSDGSSPGKGAMRLGVSKARTGNRDILTAGGCFGAPMSRIYAGRRSV